MPSEVEGQVSRTLPSDTDGRSKVGLGRAAPSQLLVCTTAPLNNLPLNRRGGE